MQINIEKRSVFLILAVVILLAGVLVIATTYTQVPANFVGHTADNVWVKIGPNEKSLQSAINDSNFITNLPESTTCAQLFTTTDIELKTGTINVPPQCIGRPCKIVMIITRTKNSVPLGPVDIMFGDYYQVTSEDDTSKARWEIFGNVRSPQTPGLNGDSNYYRLMTASNLYLYDDSATETSPTQWSYNDNSDQYGMIVKVCNY